MHHDVIAFLTSINEKVGPEGRFLHKGMTSSDVLDTCFNIQLSQSSKIIIKDIDEILRVLKKKGVNIYTARHTGDGDYKKGIHRGEDLYENDGFIVHFFSKTKVNNLLHGFKNLSIENFEEGKFPRKLFLVKNEKI